MKHSKDFNGTLDDVIKLCGFSRQSYYKYKKLLKNRYMKKRTFTEPTTVFLSPSFNLAIKAYPTIKKGAS